MDSDDDFEFIMRNNMQAIINTNTVIQGVLAITKAETRRIRNDRPFTGRSLITNILQGHPQRCLDLFRMTPTTFRILCDEVVQKGILKTAEVSVEEQIRMFFQILGHSMTMRKVGEDFQRSLETIHRCFKDVLRSVLHMQRDYIRLPGVDTPVHAQVSEDSCFSPFKVSIIFIVLGTF
jgi:spore coat polysaccharide biosynthesis protein SpsF (cytidylyltransferase family)